MGVLGMSRQTALWDAEAADVVAMKWAHYEQMTGKDVPWAATNILDRVAEILTKWTALDGNAANSSDNGSAGVSVGTPGGPA